MANITLDIANIGEKVLVHDVDLEHVTNWDLIDAALFEGILKKDNDFKGMWQYGYCVIGKNNAPVGDKAPLSSLGFADGDTIRVVSQPI